MRYDVTEVMPPKSIKHQRNLGDLHPKSSVLQYEQKQYLPINPLLALRFFFFFFLMIRPPPRSTLFPSPTLFRSADSPPLADGEPVHPIVHSEHAAGEVDDLPRSGRDAVVFEKTRQRCPGDEADLHALQIGRAHV